MVTIRRNHMVILAHQGNCPNRDRFLADVEVEKTTHFIFLILAECEVLETSDPNHRPIKVDLVLRGQAAVHR